MSTKSHNKKLLNNNNARNRNNKLEKELEIYGDGFAPPHHHSAPLSVDYRPSLIRFLELKTRCFVLLLQLCGIWILVMLANWAGAAVASCSSSNSSSSGLSEMTERKRARLLNKQNKMLAEYRLVAASAAARDCGPASKKIKLHGDPGATAGGNNPNEHQHDNLDSEAFKAMKQELRERKRALSVSCRFVGHKIALCRNSFSFKKDLWWCDLLVSYFISFCRASTSTARTAKRHPCSSLRMRTGHPCCSRISSTW